MTFEELGPEHERAFLDFLADLRRGDPATAVAEGFGGEVHDFASFARAAAAERRDWRPKAGQTSRTRYLLLDENGVAGYATLLFPLGGKVDVNFTVVVPPARRGSGFGTVTLNRLLFEGARAGLARARVACATADAPARAAITRNRGIFDRELGGRAWFWIPLR